MTIEEYVASFRHGLATATFADLANGEISRVPSRPGVYMVLAPTPDPRFAIDSVGGHFKGRDPTVPIEVLEQKWVPGAPLLYIGKADDLQRRLREYARFGSGKRIGHWGGRYIWQLQECQGLVVMWVPTPDEDPRQAERRLLRVFESEFGQLPFANLAR